MAIIEFDNVTYSYGEIPALDKASLRIEAGEFVCVLGANGSGKSTLAKHMNGLLVPSEGSVRVLGHDTRDAASLVHVRSGVGSVFQNPDDQIVATLVKDDVAFGPDNLGLPHDEVRERVDEALGKVGLGGFGEHDVSTLSGGQKQLVAIAGALAMRPHALVLDEASAMLDAPGRENLLRVCRALADAGTAIVLITHLVQEAAAAERIIALERGRVNIDGPRDAVLADKRRLEELGLIAPFERNAGKRHQPGDMTAGQAGSPALRFDGVSFAYRDGKRDGAPLVLREMNLDVAAGEIIGIEGPMGAGKSTFLQLAAGLLKPTAGHVLVEGVDLSGRNAASARRNVGIVFQYPEHQLFAATVYDDVAFGPRNFGLSEADVQAHVREALAQVGLDFDELRDRSPFSLSGGQQRLVAIAGMLACRPHVLILDEPTAGLDPRARRDLLQLVDELNAAHGITVVLASHNHDDLIALSDRIVNLGD